MYRVFLGVGHGGVDPGAICGLIKEKDLNLNIAVACKDFLVTHGIEVKLSRETDIDDPLIEEIKECNAFCADIAVDIHNNAGGGDGFEVYYHSKRPNTKKLAQAIEGEVIKLGQNSRGCKIRLTPTGSEYYGFIRQTNCDSVIVECAFIDNPKDFEIINTLEKQRVMGEALGRGILKYLGIEENRVCSEAITLEGLRDLLSEKGISHIKI